MHPALLVCSIIVLQFVPTALGGDGRDGAFGGHHAALHRRVAALDARHVQESCSATNQRAAREGQFRHRLPAAIIDGACAIGNAAAAFQNFADRRVGFPALEFLERRKVRVVIVEPHREAQGHLAIGLMIEEAAAIGIAQRPALTVDHPTRHMLFGRDVPQLLQADAVNLRLAVLAQIEPVDDLLGKMAARAFGEEGVLGVDFQAGRPAVFLGTILGDAHVAGGDALHAAIIVEQHFGRGKAGEDFHAQRFCLGGEPAGEIAEADGIAALVLHERRQQRVREFIFLGFREHPVMVLRHRHGQRRIHRAPLGQQLIKRAGIDHRARQDMRADFAALFEHAHRKLDTQPLCFLLGPDCRGKASWPTAHDHQVIGHRFPFAHVLSPSSRRRIRLAQPCHHSPDSGTAKA